MSDQVDETSTEPPTPGHRPPRRRSALTAAALAVLLGSMAAAMFASHRQGHWWGDDWALYLHQAQSLLDGNPGQVIDDNAFSVDNSRGPAFSPPLYPWGFPMLLAPFVAVVGQDVDRLTVVPVLCAMVFALCWFDLARRRIGDVAGLVGVVAVTLTPLLVGWTELLQSEWPFLAVTGVALVTLDRLAASGAFVDTSRSWWPLIGMGLAATAAFSVRREGLAITGAVAVAQLVALGGLERGWWHDRDRRTDLALRVLAPHVTALASVGVLQVVLPSTLVPRYSGTSMANVWRFRGRHIEHLAEVAGLKRTWQESPEVLGSVSLGWMAVVGYLGAALVGILLAVVLHRRRDLHLVAYLVGALLIGGSFRSAINRYVVSMPPILLLLGAVAVAAAARRAPWRFTAPVVVTILLGLIAAGNVVQARQRIQYADAVAAAGAIEWGPTHPDAIEMFESVVALSEPDDVIAAPKARAMTLLTGRRSVQIDDARPVPSIELGLLVAERNSAVVGQLAADPAYDEVWSNARFTIFAPADGP